MRKFQKATKGGNFLRNKYSYNRDDFILTIVGELNKNKNQVFLINSIKKLNIKLLLGGDGPAHTKRKVYHPITQILYNEIWKKSILQEEKKGDRDGTIQLYKIFVF